MVEVDALSCAVHRYGAGEVLVRLGRALLAIKQGDTQTGAALMTLPPHPKPPRVLVILRRYITKRHSA